MDTYYVLDGTMPIEVMFYGKISARQTPMGAIAQVYVKRRGEEILIDREDLITVHKMSASKQYAKVILSTDNDLSGFFFFVNLAIVNGMTLDEQTAYAITRAKQELIRVLYTAGLTHLGKLNAKFHSLHLHQPIDGTIDNYMCDHKHDTLAPIVETPDARLLAALTGNVKESPMESLFKLRNVIASMSEKDKNTAINTFLSSESEDVQARIQRAEFTSDGRDEYLKKFALVHYLRYAKALMPSLSIKPNLILQSLYEIEFEFRKVRVDQLALK